MIGFYIIFGLLCILLGFAIVSWFIVYKEIRDRINDYSDYTFQKQKEHKDTILNQISTLTIYVKKKIVEENIEY